MMQPDDPVDAPVAGLVRPKAFREAKAWADLSPDERKARLKAQREEVRRQQRDRAMDDLLALLKTGRVQAGIATMAKLWTSRRNIRRLKQRAEAGDRTAAWAFIEATRLAVQLAIAQGAAQVKPGKRGPTIRVSTRFATEAEKCGGAPLWDDEPRPTVEVGQQDDGDEEE